MLIVVGIGVGVGVAQVTFDKGELRATYVGPFDKTWQAAIEGLMTSIGSGSIRLAQKG